MTDPATIAAGLTEAQKRFIKAASRKPKTWGAIHRHAKIAPAVALRFGGHQYLQYHFPKWSLTPLGLEVRKILENQP